MSTPLEIRNARVFAAAQARRDASEPAAFYEDDDDYSPLTDEDALAQATDECLSNASGLSYHIGHLCDVGETDREPVSATVLMAQDFDPSTAGSGLLLVMMFEGSAANSWAAANELRERIKSAMAGEINARALELLAEDALNCERVAA